MYNPPSTANGNALNKLGDLIDKNGIDKVSITVYHNPELENEVCFTRDISNCPDAMTEDLINLTKQIENWENNLDPT
jgi:hypothetical protein